MSLSRRSIFKFGAATAAAPNVLPQVARALLPKQKIVNNGLGAPFALHTYEEGVDQAPVVVGSGVIAVAGVPVYAAAEAVHEGMGWLSTTPEGGGLLVYANPNPAASSGSVYLTPHVVSGAPATVVALLKTTSAGSAITKVRLRADLRVDLVTADGTKLAMSTTRWTAGTRMRVDWQQSWDGKTSLLTVWLFLGDNIEGWRPDEVLTGKHPSASPANVLLGNGASDNVVGFDTYREYNTAGTPPPYAPLAGAEAVHTFDEGVDGAAVRAGANMVRLVAGAPTYSAAAALHGTLGVVIPAARLGATMTYANPYPPAHTGSLYVMSATRGKGPSQVVSVQSGFSVLTQITVGPQGSVCITDPVGNVLSESVTKARLSVWTRIDWQVTWDGLNATVTVRYFPTDADTTEPYSEITATLPSSATPDTLVIGTPATTWRVYVDSFRTYGDVDSWPAPLNPVVAHLFSLIGEMAADGATVSSMLINVASADLAVSVSADMSDPVFAGVVTADADHLLRHTIVGLSPETQYFAKLAGSGGVLFGDPLTFRTLPAPATPIVGLRIALLSCQQSVGGDPLEAGWQNILDWNPQLLLHGGDFGYWGGTLKPEDLYQKHLAAYRLQFSKFPIMRQVLMSRTSLIQVSDHETSGNNGDNLDDPVTVAALAAYQKIMPIQSYGDVRSPLRGRFLARNLGANIRLISIDFRSLDRSLGATADGADKTALGTAQMEWLHNELTRPEALKIILSDPAWGPADPPTMPVPTAFLDKWWNYRTSQQTIADIVQNELTSTGGPINVDFWGNDRHLMGYLSRENNVLGGFSVLCGSGIDQHGLLLMPGELYDQSFVAPSIGTPIEQYMRIDLGDDNAGTITRTATAWDCISNTAKFAATDVWTY